VKEIPKAVYLYSDVPGSYPNELAWSETDFGDSIAKYVRAELHTLVACTVCGRGVRVRDSVAKMCPSCAGAEIERLRGIEEGTLWGQKMEFAVESWREQAAQFREDGVIGWAECCDNIAAALEAKP